MSRTKPEETKRGRVGGDGSRALTHSIVSNTLRPRPPFSLSFPPPASAYISFYPLGSLAPLSLLRSLLRVLPSFALLLASPSSRNQRTPRCNHRRTDGRGRTEIRRKTLCCSPGRPLSFRGTLSQNVSNGGQSESAAFWGILARILILVIASCRLSAPRKEDIQT